jgi:O-antigen/teichoic acid export membrane protein
VGAGLLISGVTSYVFLKLVRAGIGSDEATEPVNQLWFLTFLLAPGFFLPVEQEVGRALAHRRALGQGGGPVVRRAAMLALALAALTTVPLIGAGPVLVDTLFADNWALLVCLVMAFLSWSSAHLARGILSGSGRFGPYGLLLGVDGLLRVVASGVLTLFSVANPAAWGLAIALPPVIAVGVALRGQRGLLAPGPEADWSELTPNLGWLVAGSVLAAMLVNGGPIVAGLLKEEGQSALVSHFTYAVIITRIPLFLFQAVQAALLPKLAQLAARGAIDEFRTGFRKLIKVVMVVGTVGVVGALAVGTTAVKIFSTEAELSRRTVGLLALASALYMLGLAMAQAIIALHGHARVALGWSVAVAVFLVTAWVWGHDLLLRVEMGLVLGSAAAVAVFSYAYQVLVNRSDTGVTLAETGIGDSATLAAPLPFDEA